MAGNIKFDLKPDFLVYWPMVAAMNSHGAGLVLRWVGIAAAATTVLWGRWGWQDYVFVGIGVLCLINELGSILTAKIQILSSKRYFGATRKYLVTNKAVGYHYLGIHTEIDWSMFDSFYYYKDKVLSLVGIGRLRLYLPRQAMGTKDWESLTKMVESKLKPYNSAKETVAIIAIVGLYFMLAFS